MPRESACLSSRGDRENVIELDADHSGVCKFGESQAEQDNLKLVRANLQDLYKRTLKDCKFTRLPPISLRTKY